MYKFRPAFSTGPKTPFCGPSEQVSPGSAALWEGPAPEKEPCLVVVPCLLCRTCHTVVMGMLAGLQPVGMLSWGPLERSR